MPLKATNSFDPLIIVGLQSEPLLFQNCFPQKLTYQEALIEPPAKALKQSVHTN